MSSLLNTLKNLLQKDERLVSKDKLLKNKIIELAIKGDEFISEKKEVVLSWPYKDCVLEGGVTKEDQKRDEIFWNEALAPDKSAACLTQKFLPTQRELIKTANTLSVILRRSRRISSVPMKTAISKTISLSRATTF